MKRLFSSVITTSLILASVNVESREVVVPEACKAIQEMSEDEFKALPFVQRQRMKADCVGGDFLNSVDKMYEAVKDDPVEYGGCLDHLRGIDISVVTFDPESLIEGAYSTIMDQITNFSCDAFVEAANEATDGVVDSLNNMIDSNLPSWADPLGSVNVDTGRTFNGSEDLLRSSYRPTNEEVQEKINEELWDGDTPPVRYNKQFNRANLGELLTPKESTPRDTGVGQRKETQRLNLKNLFKKDDDTDGGN